MANRLAEHQGRTPQPGVPTGKRNRRRPRRNRIAEHEGRTPQPGVPTGERNRPRPTKPTKAERRNRAFAASLAVKPPTYHRLTAKEKAERKRAAAAAAVLREVSHNPKLGTKPKSPKVPTLTGRNTGNRSGYTPTKAEALAAPALSDLDKLKAEGKLGKTLGQKIVDQTVKWAPVVAPEVAPALEGLQAAVAVARGVRAGDEIVGGSRVLSRVLRPVEATSTADRAAVGTRVAEKAAAKESSGVKAAAKRAGEKVTRAQSKADAAVARKVAGRSTRHEAVAAAGPPLKVAKVGAAQTLPVVRGHEQAIVDNPGKVAGTTLRAIPGLVTVPVGQAAAVTVSGGRAASAGLHSLGVPGFRAYSGSQIAAPIAGLAKEQAAFARQVAQVVTADDPKEVQEAVEDELGLMLPIMLGLGTKAAADKLSRGRITDAVKRIADQTRAAQHKGESVRVSRASLRARRETQDRTRQTRRHAARAKGSEVLEGRTVRGGRVFRRDKKLRIHAGDIANFLQRHSIDPLDNPDAALAEVKRIGAHMKPLPEGMTTPRSKITTRDVIGFIERNPSVLTDKHVAAEIDEFRKQGRYAREHAADLAPEHSERARFVPTAVTRDVPLTEERFPRSVRDITRAAPTRGALAKDVLRRESKSDRQRARRLGRKAARGENRARIMKREAAIRETQVEPRVASEVARKEKIRRLEARRRNIAAKRQALRDQGSTSKLMGQYQRAQEKINRQLEELQVEPMTARKKQRIQLERHAEGRAAVASRQRKMATASRDAATRKFHAATEIDPAIEPEFVGEMEDRLRAEGRPNPEWSSTSTAREAPAHGATGAKLAAVPGKSKFRSGTAEEFGLVQEDLGHWLNESVGRPVGRRETYKAMRSFLEDNQWESPAGRTEFTSSEARRIFDEPGGPSRDDYTLIPAQLYKRALDPDDLAGQFRIAVDDKGEIAPGRRYRLVRRPAADEFLGQLEAKTIAPKVAAVNRATSFLILGTSPAWAAAQIVAEYAQGAAAQPKILNPAFIKKAMAAYAAMPDKDRWAFEGWSGITRGDPVAPGELQLDLRTGDVAAAADAYSVMNRTALGRFIKSIPRGLQHLDQWKGGRIRFLTAAAKIDHDLNSRLPVFLRGVRGLHDELGAAVAEMKGKPLNAQLSWVADHPKWAKRYGDYLDDVLGNWHALTRKEQVASRLLIFYPFIRMAARWTFYAFPRRHPLKAAMLYYLGQQNAATLHRLLGGDPSYFTEWATIPISLGGGKTDLLPLSRIAPGTGLATELLGEGSKNLPGLALSSLQPGVAAAIIAATGVDPRSGEQKPGRGVAALSQLLNLSPVARLANTELMPSGRKATDQALPVAGPLFGSTERQKALDKLFAKLEQTGSGSQAALRLVEPTQPRKLSYERDLVKLKAILEAIDDNSSEKRGDLAEAEEERAAGANEAKLRKIELTTARKTERMSAAYERAQQELDAMLKAYKIPADPWTGEVYSIGKYGTAVKNTPPAGMLGGRRVAGSTTSSGGSTPPAGTLGSRRVRVPPARPGRSPSAPRVGRLPPAETLGGVKVR